MPNTNINRKIVMLGSTLDPATLAYLSYCNPKPSESFIISLNTFIKQIKSIGVFNEIDRLWITAADTGCQQNALISIVNPSSTACTENNSPTWTAKQGYTGNASNMFIDSNYAPATHGVKFSLNANSVFYYSRTNSAQTGYDVGTSGGGALTRVVSRSAGNTYGGNNNGLTTWTQANTDSRGLFHVSRTSSSNVNLYRNGTLVTSKTENTTALPTLNVYLLGYNNAGTLTNPCSRQLSMWGFGSQNVLPAEFYTAFQAFAIEQGFNV